MGHTSSYDCYVAGVDEARVMQFDNHAEFCSICVDITQDTMRMMDEGKSTAEIFAQVEADYGRFAPPTVKIEGGESG
jgi:F0F1-type ATP synthase alpha subunit